MKVPYVHSNYARREGDYYPTIDPRCVHALIQHYDHYLKEGVIDVCAPEGSGIVDTFKSLGFPAVGWADAFQDAKNNPDAWVVTNPPYVRPLVDKIIMRQVKRVQLGQVWGFACLLRSNFDFAKSRQAMFADPLYYGQIKMRFRPWWTESREKQPIHSYVWHLWMDGNWENKIVLYADGALHGK